MAVKFKWVKWINLFTYKGDRTMPTCKIETDRKWFFIFRPKNKSPRKTKTIFRPKNEKNEKLSNFLAVKRKIKRKTHVKRKPSLVMQPMNALKSCNEITRLHSSVHNFTMFSVQLVRPIQVPNTVSKWSEKGEYHKLETTVSLRSVREDYCVDPRNLSSCTKRLLTGNACSWGRQRQGSRHND